MIAFAPARRIPLPPRNDDTASEPEIALSVHEQGRGPAVVLCHGFPELAFSWRHQLPALAEAGFRAIAPDQRGYGQSSRPEPIEAYDLVHLTGDLVGLLDALEIEKAVFVGHDWGKMYILWFQEPGVAEAVLTRDVRLLFERLKRHGVAPEVIAARVLESGELDMNPFRRLSEIEPLGEPLLSPEELEVFVSSFTRSGFAGPVNWYRNFDRNWEIVPEVGTDKIEVPSLMVTAAWDPVLRPEMAAGMPALVPDLETRRIEECGHWTQQEKPGELNRILVDWLSRRMRSTHA
jgi:pimeloyl-ACP methyl ester carboxylesterase